jgi:hypothetical protein
LKYAIHTIVNLKNYCTFRIVLLVLISGSAVFYFFLAPKGVHELASSVETVGRMSSSDEEPDIAEGKNIEQERLSVSIPSQTEFSPLDSGIFIVSFFFSQEVAPVFHRRQKLVAHYEADKAPYTGWAIAFRRFPSSYRFEFYLKDRAGAGGWFSFDTIDIKKDKWYAITFVVKADQYLFSLITPLDPDLKPSGKTQRLGGFPLSGIQELETQSRLQITSGKPKIGPFRGSVRGFTVLQLDELPGEKIFSAQVREGPRSLLTEYPDRCIISLYETGNTGVCKYKHP